MNEEIILKQCMGIKKEENLLLVYDRNRKKIADSIYDKAKSIGFEARTLETPIAKENGEEPPEEVAEEMLNHDVILLITTKSLSHTKARRDASEKGARIASMPGITEDIISRLDVDYKKMEERIKKIKSYFLKGKKKEKKIKVLTEKGTNLEMEIGNTRIECDSGIYVKKGDFGNLPAGEAGILPKNTNGIFIVDATFAGIGKLDEPIKITVKDNYAVKIEGKDAEKLLEILNRFGKKARNIAEFAIGTNEKAEITGATLEDEKVLGTAHIALGNNLSFGGNVDVPLHLDGVMYKPTIYVDNKLIMEKGKLK